MKKIKYSNLLILGVFIYIIFQVAIALFSKSVSVAVLKEEELEAKIKTEGIIIRDEYLVKSDTKGSLKRLVKEGDRVKKSQEVINVYKNNKYDEIALEVENLNQEIKKIENENVSNELDKDMKLKKIETKKDEKKILEDKMKKDTSKIKSDTSGIISYKYDGKEEQYSIDNISKITKTDINTTDNKYKECKDTSDKIKEDEVVFRLINNNEVYLGISIDKKQAKYFEVNQNVKLRQNNEDIDAKVHEIYKDGDERIIIFKITSQNVGIYDTRVAEFDIIYKQIEGLKIPKSSIKTIDNKRGVYVVDEESQNAHFVVIEGIAYENENFVFVDYYKNNINGIKSVDRYDEIVLNPNGINKNIKIK